MTKDEFVVKARDFMNSISNCQERVTLDMANLEAIVFSMDQRGSASELERITSILAEKINQDTHHALGFAVELCQETETFRNQQDVSFDGPAIKLTESDLIPPDGGN